MALTSAGIKLRMDRELRLLGQPDADEKTDLLVTAVRRFIRMMDRPVTSASLTVTTSKGPYSVPATIGKLQDIRDAATTPASVTYTYDETKNEITFQSNPTAGTWTVYGMPASVRTNIDTIVGNISEDDEDVLWGYILAFAHRWGNSGDFVSYLQAADFEAKEARKSRNRNLDSSHAAIKHLDTQGRNIGDNDNSENITVDISDNFDMDL